VRTDADVSRVIRPPDGVCRSAAVCLICALSLECAYDLLLMYGGRTDRTLLLWMLLGVVAVLGYRMVVVPGPSRHRRGAANGRIILTALAGVVVIASATLLLGPREDVMEAVQHVSGTADLLISVLPVPAVEEVVYRGLVFGVVLDRFGTAPAIIGSSLLFALGHGVMLPDFRYVCVIAVVGLVLGWLRAWSGGIRLPLAVHCGLNLLALTASRMG
jgi:membrane protease YdiL (CAAX protease family)